MPDLKTIELYIAPGCPHCPNMIKVASELVKNGDIGKLEIINIAIAQDLAQQASIRSVPTFRIGEVSLTGVHTAKELIQWVTKSASPEGLTDFFNQAFEQGQLNEVTKKVENKPVLLDHLLDMLADMETPFTSRIAISAVFEHFQNSAEIGELVPRLCDLAQDEHGSIRTDMAYILGLTGNLSAIPCLEKLVKDDFDDARETALESIQAIKESTQA